MKNTILSIVGVIILALVIAIPAARAFPSYFSVNSSATATSTLSQVNPQTTYTYNLGGGFNTLLADVDSSYVFVLATASSTDTSLKWTVQYSNNNADWFESDNIIASSAGQPIIHASSSNTWIVGTTTPASAIGKVITIPTVSAYYKRVVFTTAVGTSTIWVQDTEKRNTSGN